jgi:crotonobetainyl-CoA:carnitine CoA-transferase CaiB-like acyl-CoA transferase
MTDGMPLHGIRVVDLTRLIPGGLSSLNLAQLGADVVKVELPPNGDHLRSWPPVVEGTGALFAALNRGKQSVVVDYRQPEGRSRLDSLLEQADVLIESFRPEILRKYRLGYDDLHREHRRLVYCSISGYGQSGPFRDMPSHGLNLDGATGRLTVQRAEGSDGSDLVVEGQPGLPAAVVFGGLHAALGICAGLVQARTSGVGCYIDASCWDSALTSDPWLSYKALNGLDTQGYRASAESPRLSGYLTRDGEVLILCPVEPHLWERFCHAVDRPDLIASALGSDWEKGDMKLHPEIAGIIRGRTMTEWMDIFEDAGVPASPVYDTNRALLSPHGVERELAEGTGPAESQTWYVRRPLIIDGQRPPSPGAPPGLGEHTAQHLAAEAERYDGGTVLP